jgi:hypothetical protein
MSVCAQHDFYLLLLARVSERTFFGMKAVSVDQKFRSFDAHCPSSGRGFAGATVLRRGQFHGRTTEPE